MWGLRQGSLSIGNIMINRDQKLMIFCKILIAHVVKYPFASGWKVPASPWWFLSLRWVYYGMFVESGGFNPTVMAFINEEMPINERMEWGDLFSDKSTLLFWFVWLIYSYLALPSLCFQSSLLICIPSIVAALLIFGCIPLFPSASSGSTGYIPELCSWFCRHVPLRLTSHVCT